MSCASQDFEPVQQPGERCRQPEQNEQVAERRSGLDGGNGEGAEDADPNERRDPRDAGGHDDAETPTPRLDDLHECAEGRPPANRGRSIRHRFGSRLSGRFDFRTISVVPRRGVIGRKGQFVPALFGLAPHQPAIGTVAPDQLGVPARLDDAALIEDQDAVGGDHARQPMREDQGRASGRQAVNRLLDHRLVFSIDRGESLVEDQDRRVAQQGAGNRQALALPPRQHDPPLADHRGVALRQGHDELVGVGIARRRLDFFPLGIGLAEPQIILDGAVEQIGVLVDDGDHPPECLEVERLQIVAADPYRPALRVEEAQQQARDRGFAGAAGTDNADFFAGGDGKRETVMGSTPPAGISKIDVLKRDRWKKPPP